VGALLGPEPGVQPLGFAAPSLAAAAAWGISGGSGHQLELGLRGERWPERGSEITLTATGRIVLSRTALLGWWPFLAGGLRAGVLHQGHQDAAAVVGPHLLASLATEWIDGTLIGLEIGAHAALTEPLRVTVAVGLTVWAGG
jgi:hypothetical protein